MSNGTKNLPSIGAVSSVLLLMIHWLGVPGLEIYLRFNVGDDVFIVMSGQKLHVSSLEQHVDWHVYVSLLCARSASRLEELSWCT
mmetsp:Transcript_11746/g.19155  ORF Transcript_11746/g.19155 Transcript_11746/m.19155 type:complete len:85 (-) Transcript_11746:2060-2314(-)